MDDVECLVIGAGVVGLATARALARAGREVLIVEAAGAYGEGVSARNSEVIHAGIYYPKGSLKARLCVEGRARLYDFCASRKVGFARCGKLIVADAAEGAAALTPIGARARANGVDDLRELTEAEALALEPALACSGALLSPSTGIVDSHGLMTALLGEAEGAGAMLALNAPVTGLSPTGSGWRVETGGAAPFALHARLVVNAAGLSAPALGRAAGLPAPRDWLAKGAYFKLTGRAPFGRLIYPTPQPGGLGVHLTLDLSGAARFGPDVEWIEAADYAVDPSRAAGFEAAIRRYWPGLPDGALAPDYAGIRPKIAGPGAPSADLMIESHGAPGYLGLYGIESPGLTSALAIAAHVAERI